MKPLLLALLCLACCLAATEGALGRTRALSRALPAEIAAGQRIFDAQCAWCHGTGGSGGTGPTLQRPALRHATNDASLVSIVRNGIPGTEMPGFALSLTDRMAWRTAAYVRSLGHITARPLPGDVRRGASLYEASGCASCHVVRGAGGVLGPDLTAIGALRGPAHLREALIDPAATHPPGYLVGRAVSRDGTEIRGIVLNEDVFWVLLRDPAGKVRALERAGLSRFEREPQATLMPSYATRLSAAELDDLVAYLATLRGER